MTVNIEGPYSRLQEVVSALGRLDNFTTTQVDKTNDTDTVSDTLNILYLTIQFLIHPILNMTLLTLTLMPHLNFM